MKDFIKNNKLSFKTGSRNSTVTTLVGYSQHLGLTMSELKTELTSQINKDIFIAQEIERLWSYCSSRNYGNWWKTADAKLMYKF